MQNLQHHRPQSSPRERSASTREAASISRTAHYLLTEFAFNQLVGKLIDSFCSNMCPGSVYHRRLSGASSCPSPTSLPEGQADNLISRGKHAPAHLTGATRSSEIREKKGPKCNHRRSAPTFIVGPSEYVGTKFQSCSHWGSRQFAGAEQAPPDTIK